MGNRIKKWCTDIFTEDDGQSICIAKAMAAFAFFSFLAYAGYGLYAGHFALGDFATGIMEVLTGSGAIIAGKQFSQKPQPPGN